MCCRPATRVYAGRGGRTNGAGIGQPRALLAPLGRTVIAVPLGSVLHLKSAVTALPDGTFLLLPQPAPAGLFPAVRPVAEQGGRLPCRPAGRRPGADRRVRSPHRRSPRRRGLDPGRGGHQRVRETRRLHHLPERAAARTVTPGGRWRSAGRLA